MKLFRSFNNIEWRKSVSKHELRQFGLVFAIAIPIIFSLFLPWLFDAKVNYYPLIVSAVFVPLAALWPTGLYPFWWVWGYIALVLGWLNTLIILTFIFVAIILPIGRLLRWLGKLDYKEQRNDQSLWLDSPKEWHKSDLERPF